MTLIPAYGRTYNTADEALADWKAGKDFKIYGGPYCSIRDADALVDPLDRLMGESITIVWAYPRDHRITV